jgi:hypothetical protein
MRQPRRTFAPLRMRPESASRLSDLPMVSRLFPGAPKGSAENRRREPSACRSVVPSERVLHLLSASAVPVAHEYAHAIDFALDGGIFLSEHHIIVLRTFRRSQCHSPALSRRSLAPALRRPHRRGRVRGECGSGPDAYSTISRPPVTWNLRRHDQSKAALGRFLCSHA